MDKVNEQFLLSLIIIAIGYIMRRLKIVNKSDGETMAKIAVNVTLPFLIVLTTSQIVLERSLIALPLISLGCSIISLIIGKYLFPKHSVPDRDRGLSIMTLVGYNIGLFAYPIIEGIYGKRGLQTMAMIDTGNSFAIFVLMFVTGLYFSQLMNEKKEHDGLKEHNELKEHDEPKEYDELKEHDEPKEYDELKEPAEQNKANKANKADKANGADEANKANKAKKADGADETNKANQTTGKNGHAKDSRKVRRDFAKIAIKKIFTNIPLLATIISIALAHFKWQIPEFTEKLFSTIAVCNRGLVLLMIGIMFNVDFDKKYWKMIAKILAVRYGFGLLVGTTLYFILPIEPFFKGILLISFVLPLASATIAYSAMFDFNTEVAGFLVNATNAVSFLLMWIIISLLPM